MPESRDIRSDSVACARAPGQNTKWEGVITRRSVLFATGTASALALAGCLGGDGAAVPDPVEIESDWSCDVCGMVITNHPGPNAEIYYADERPNDHDNPARFCSTWEAFQFDFEKRDAGWSREAFYVTDYSSVDFDVYQESGDTLITSHTDPDAFTDATDVTFVVASDAKGAMGQDLIGFSDNADAEEFAEQYGGDVVAFADVTRDTIAALGM